jgi:hypothetical protein
MLWDGKHWRYCLDGPDYSDFGSVWERGNQWRGLMEPT